jgi:hypothetical protein
MNNTNSSRSRFYLVFILLSLFLTACVNQNNRLYQWGSYENMVYESYHEPGKYSSQSQIIEMEKDLEKARAANKSLPPGHYAYLGYLYFQSGQLDKALTALQTEKTIFPESTIYMDRLIAQIKK